MPRVFGECQIFTATGRVSMAEPNVQNIPKDFAIELPGKSQIFSHKSNSVLHRFFSYCNLIINILFFKKVCDLKLLKFCCLDHCFRNCFNEHIITFCYYFYIM